MQSANSKPSMNLLASGGQRWVSLLLADYVSPRPPRSIYWLDQAVLLSPVVCTHAGRKHCHPGSEKHHNYCGMSAFNNCLHNEQPEKQVLFFHRDDQEKSINSWLMICSYTHLNWCFSLEKTAYCPTASTISAHCTWSFFFRWTARTVMNSLVLRNSSLRPK